MSRSCKDRLAVVVTGTELEREQLLCIPGLEGGTAVEQVDALIAILVQHNLDPLHRLPRVRHYGDEHREARGRGQAHPVAAGGYCPAVLSVYEVLFISLITSIASIIIN